MNVLFELGFRVLFYLCMRTYQLHVQHTIFVCWVVVYFFVVSFKSKCYFLRNLVVVVVVVVVVIKLPLTTSVEVPGSTPGHG